MKTQSVRIGVLLFAGALMMSPADAYSQPLSTSPAEGLEEEGEFQWDASGRIRYRHQVLTDFPTDRTETIEHGQHHEGSLLFRWAPSVTFGKWLTTKLTLDIWDGQVTGDESPVAEDALLTPYQVPTSYSVNRLVREAYVDAYMGVGRLRAGRMASQWGMGLLANGGDKEPEAFADATHGDISNRILFLTRPLGFVEGPVGSSLFMMVGGDLVERDELTSREDGDTALQGVGALLWRTEPLEAGTYVAYRNLESAEGYKTTVLANDIYVKWTHKLEEVGTLELESEWVMLQGETEELRFIGAPYPIDILQFGGAANARWSPAGEGILASLGLGWAPGDNAPKDGTARGIRFDPGFKAGMILFEEVMGRLSAQSHDNASDPALVAVPSQGVERVATNGAVHNAAYLFPQVGYLSLDQRLDTRIGALIAFSSGDVVDPFSSALFGGFNRNAFDQEGANGHLGTELLAGVSFKQGELWETLGVRIGFEYGVFLPGDALMNGEGDNPIGTLHKGRLLADIFW